MMLSAARKKCGITALIRMATSEVAFAKYDKAIADFNKAIQLGPDDAGAHRVFRSGELSAYIERNQKTPRRPTCVITLAILTCHLGPLRMLEK